ncbi:MAG: hypothetical protein QM533_11250 [Cytophagales bacterium]|nr:hypothetical protein [Cytophagales bacterium]
MQAAFNTDPTPAPFVAMQSMLLRLPSDLMAELSRVAPSRGRNQFVVETLQRDLERRRAESDAQIIAACEALNAYEASNPAFAAEGMEWVNAVLTEDDGEVFDEAEFEQAFAATQAQLPANERLA